MGCPTVKVAFEDALNKTTLNNSDKFLAYDNGTVYNVTYSDIITSAGLTGSLTGANEGGAVPVLTGAAPSYSIRGIVGGNGISASVNPSGSITINTQLANAGNTSSGEGLIQNVAASSILFKRLRAGNGISLTAESDSIIIDNTEVAVSNNTVIVSELSDFPTAVSGVITLQDNKDYLIVGNISTASRFVLGNNTIIRAADPRSVTLTYTGTDTMFTLQNGFQVIKDIGLSCPSGTLISGAGNTTGTLVMRWLVGFNIKTLGVIDKPVTVIQDVLINSLTGNGFSYGAVTNRRLLVVNLICLSATNPSLAVFSLNSATFNSLNLQYIDFLSTVSGQVFLSGVAGGANLAADSIGYINHVNIQGDMAGLGTITTDDAGWDFSECNKITDTDPHCLIYMSTTPSTTTIATVSTPVAVNGVFTTENEQLFDANVNGRIVYKGKRDKFVRIDMTISLEPASGTNKDITIQLAKNGVMQAMTRVIRTSSAGSAAVLSLDWGFDLSTDDFIEVFVGNDTDNIDVVVNQLLLRAS